LNSLWTTGKNINQINKIVFAYKPRGEICMADLKDRCLENNKGEFYVDESCITCGRCVSTAPYNFSFSYGDKHVFCSKTTG